MMGTGNKILVVDDNDIIRELLTEAMKHYLPGMAVYSAADVRLGWCLVNDIYPKVIVTDIGMPEFDGIYFLKLIKGKYPEITVIVFSAEVGMGEAQIPREKLISLGAAEAFTKPTDFSVIAAEVKKYL